MHEHKKSEVKEVWRLTVTEKQHRGRKTNLPVNSFLSLMLHALWTTIDILSFFLLEWPTQGFHAECHGGPWWTFSLCSKSPLHTGLLPNSVQPTRAKPHWFWPGHVPAFFHTCDLKCPHNQVIHCPRTPSWWLLTVEAGRSDTQRDRSSIDKATKIEQFIV